MKNKLLFLLTLLITHFGFGQISFDENVIDSSLKGVNDVYSVDIDGDGDMDVLSSSINDDKIVWHENKDGQGTYFVPHTITTLANGANSVYASDIDGDGDMDVLSTSYYDAKIAWYENTDGQGTFGTQQTIGTLIADNPFSVHASDIDGDGDMDVLSTSYYDSKILWYENTDGQGTFGTQQTITTNAAGAYSVYSVDIDGDGDMDVLSASSLDSKIAWYENTDGQGTFGSQQTITTLANGAKSVCASDLDGDGDMDVLSASNSKIAWYENTDGQGTFGAQQTISTSVNAAYSVHARDVDGDGDLDVLSASHDPYGNQYGKIAWYENTDGQGAFSAQQIIQTIDSSTTAARSVHVSDIDGDGDIDVLSAGFKYNKITWFQNTDGQGTFDNGYTISPTAYLPRSVFASDLDGDGDMDMLSTSYDNGKLGWYENIDGQGSFGPHQIITTDGINGSSVYANDIDGDGDIDVLFISHSKIAWYENTDGQGTFSAQQNITTSIIGGSSVYASDIDGDGDMDVLSASRHDNKIAWYENTDGQGSFGTEQIITTSANTARSVYASDIDGDGDMDVLSASSLDNKIAWYKNDGQGNFGVQRIISTKDGAYSVYSVDIDGDGDMDVLSAALHDDEITWYENTDGYGTFGIHHTITTIANGARSVYASDIDGDGDMDVLSAAYTVTFSGNSNSSVAWYENTNGQGSFGSQQVISTTAEGAYSVYASDINGDGRMDVLSASSLDSKIAWYKNNGENLSIAETTPMIFKVYPNPTKGLFTIQANGGIEKLIVYDINGRQLKAIEVKDYLRQYQLNISNLSKGIYFVKIQTDLGIQTKKISKQ